MKQFSARPLGQILDKFGATFVVITIAMKAISVKTNQ